MIPFDPRQPAFLANPYPLFHQLRQAAPVYRSDLLGGWMLTRHDDVKLAISDRRFSADRMRPFFANLPADARRSYAVLADSICRWAVFHDPPEHTRLRALMNKAFTTSAIDMLAPRIEHFVSLLLDRWPRQGQVDLIRDFAYPLPASVILDMLGLPTTDLDQLKVWSDELALFVGSAVNSADKYARANDSITAMNAYFQAAIERHRARPADDLLTALIAARDQGQVLSDADLVATCVLLVFAGHETTTNLIGNGLLALLRAPDQWQLLQDEPSLAPSAVEELLRFDSPAATVVRVTREPVTFRDVALPAGARVFAMLGAANRDPAVFPDPDRLDIRRGDNRHISFGHGIHFCLGAPLARLEARIALSAIARRFPSLRLVEGPLEWSDSLVLRGVKSLPLQVAA